MDVVMLSRLGQTLLVAAPGVAGDGLLERLRNVTIAMLAAVAAIGLLLVGVVSREGWPRFADSPFPLLPIERIGDAQVAEEPNAPISAPAGPQGRPAPSIPAVPAPPGGGRGSDVRGTSKHPADSVGPAVESPTPVQGTTDAPVGTPPPPVTPAPAPVTTAPAPTAAPTAPSGTKSPGGGNGQAKGHENGGGPSGGGQAKSVP